VTNLRKYFSVNITEKKASMFRGAGLFLANMDTRMAAAASKPTWTTEIKQSAFYCDLANIDGTNDRLPVSSAFLSNSLYQVYILKAVKP